MRRVRYNVAASLDGFITDEDGRFDWIPSDATVDFAAIFAKVDTVLLGRHSWAVVQQMGGTPPWNPGSRIYLFSRTLPAHDQKAVTLVADRAAEVVQALRSEPGDGEIWLFGGGQLFAALLSAGQVDSIEVTIVPILLGAGTPLAGHTRARTPLVLHDVRRYPSGMVTLSYDAGTRAEISE